MSIIFHLLPVYYVVFSTIFFSVTPDESSDSGSHTDFDIGKEKNTHARSSCHDLGLAAVVRGICCTTNVRYLIGHPADFLCDTVMEAMKRAPWNTRVTHIMVDEAHCVVQWGEGFRKACQDIYNLKAISTKSSPTVVAITATSATLMQKEILRILNIEDAATIIGETDWSSIKLRVSRRQLHIGRERTAESSYTAVFMPPIE